MDVLRLYTYPRSAEVDGELRATNDLTPVEEASMKSITNTTMRAAVAIGTVVALIATVGAPFKWSMILPPWLSLD